MTNESLEQRLGYNPMKLAGALAAKQFLQSGNKQGIEIASQVIKEIATEAGYAPEDPFANSAFEPEVIAKTIRNINSTYEEGCLSVPGQFAEVDRPDKCHISYLDYNGQKQELKAEGLLATCIQHEMDHLEGILFIDYLSKLKKNFIVKKLSKQKKALERIIV